ncbi:MAG: DUF4872 domain-containing protein [Anaerolineae bacterium]|nr:DUF4872 domain-containing protein [Anaerolineae bacterium]
MPTLKDYRQFEGLHWATGYITNALAYQGITAPHTGKPYSEAMIMGINGGICAGYFSFHYEGYDPQVELLTYYPFNENLKAVYDRLNIPTDIRQTDNPTKATANIVSALARGVPALVWADMFTLSYTVDRPYADAQMVTPVLVFSHEGGRVLIADRARAPLEVTAANLLAAQQVVKKAKHRVMTLGAPDAARLPEAVTAGIRATLAIMTEAPHFAPQAASSFGFAGLQRWADELVDVRTKHGWARRFPRGTALYNVLKSSYRSLELYFTGGSGARHTFAAFLDEAADVLNRPALRAAAELYRVTASQWRQLADAHLPGDVPLLAETRALMRREYDLFIEQGSASSDERRAIAVQLAQVRAQAAAGFPLDDAAACALRENLRDRILALRAAEMHALEALRSAIA